MVSRVIAAWLLLAGPLLALDLTPLPGVKVLEGARIPAVSFQDGERTVQFQPPLNWPYSGEPQRARFFVPDAAQASVELQVAALSPEPIFSPSNVETMKAETMA